jgi:hypothetical protein
LAQLIAPQLGVAQRDGYDSARASRENALEAACPRRSLLKRTLGRESDEIHLSPAGELLTSAGCPRVTTEGVSYEEAARFHTDLSGSRVVGCLRVIGRIDVETLDAHVGFGRDMGGAAGNEALNSPTSDRVRV